MNNMTSMTVRGTGYGTGTVTYELLSTKGLGWVAVKISSIRYFERKGVLVHWNPSK